MYRKIKKKTNEKPRKLPARLLSLALSFCMAASLIVLPRFQETALAGSQIGANQYQYTVNSHDNYLTWTITMKNGFIDVSTNTMYYYASDADAKEGTIFKYYISWRGDGGTSSALDQLYYVNGKWMGWAYDGTTIQSGTMTAGTKITSGQKTLTMTANGDDAYYKYKGWPSRYSRKTQDTYFNISFNLFEIDDRGTGGEGSFVSINAADRTASVGDVFNLEATVDNGDPPSPISYESLTPEIVEVTSEGDVFCLKPGLGKIVLKTPEWRTYAPAQKTVYILVDMTEPKWYYSENSSNWGLLWEDEKVLTLGDEVTYEIWNDRDAPAEYTSLNPSVVEVVSVNSETNEITFKAVGVGDAGVYIYAPETESSTPSERNIKFKVNKPSPTITAKNKTITWGDDTINLGATVDSGANLSYFSSNEDVAYVDRFGNVTAQNAGWANITIFAEETTEFAAGEKTVRVTVEKKPPETTVDNLDLMLGEVEALNVVSESDGAVRYVSSDTSVAKVDALGNVEAVGLGTADITVTVGAYGNYAEKTVTSAVTVGELIPGNESPIIVASDMRISYGDVVPLGAKANPGGKLTYESSDTSTVDVDETGIITGLKIGEATITITSAPTRKYALGTETITVQVVGSDTKITAQDMDIQYEKPTDLGVFASSGGEITYENLNPGIVDIDENGVATGKELGSADVVISVAANGGYNPAKKTIHLKVVPATPEITVENTTVVYKETVNLGAVATTVSANPTRLDVPLNYTISDVEVAEVLSNGDLTGNNASKNGGKATVTITSDASKYYASAEEEFEITVEKAEDEISARDVSLAYGTTKSIGATTDSNAKLEYVSWDKEIASVNEYGIITGSRVGTTTITIVSEGTDNYLPATKDIEVTVEKATPVITTKSREYSVDVNGDAVNLGAEVNIFGLTLKYESSDESVATVDEYGNVLAHKVGDANITITADASDNYEAPDPRIVTVHGVATTPGAPVITLAKSGEESQVTLKWEAPENDGGSDITSYMLMRSTDGTNFTSIKENIAADAFTYVDDTAVNGTKYYYRVYAINEVGRGLPSASAEAIPCTIPNAPINFAATATSQNSVALSWNPPDMLDKTGNGGAEVTGYTVRVYADSDFEEEITDRVRIGTQVHKYDDYTVPVMNLSVGTEYFFTVEALNAASDYTDTSNVAKTSGSTWGYPDPPENLSINPITKGTIDVYWDAPSNTGGADILDYTLAYRRRGVERWTYVYEIDESPYRIEGLDADYSYEFKVKATTMVGDSEYCESITEKVIRKPDTPELVDVTSGNRGAYITAKNVKNNGCPVIAYAVYYRLHDSGDEFIKLCQLDALNENLNNVLAAGLVNGNTYDIAVSAINDAGESDLTDSVTAIPGCPTAVKNLAITPLPGQQMQITFDPSDSHGAPLLGYDVYIGGTIEGITPEFDLDGETSEFERVETITDTSYTYDAGKRINGDIVKAYIVARNDYGSSKSGVVVTGIGVPGAPKILDYYPSDDGVHVSWAAAIPNGYVITAYNVLLTDENGETAKYTFENKGDYNAVVSTSDYQFNDGEKYEIKMTAHNASGDSVYSNAETFTFGAPSKPQNVTGSADDGKLNVSWSKPQRTGGGEITGYYIYMDNDTDPTLHVTWKKSGASSYQLYVKDYRNNGPEEPYGNVLNSVDNLEVGVEGLANGSLYTARVSAENEFGEGPASDPIIAVRPNGAAGLPRNVSAKAVSGTAIDVSWRKPLNEGGLGILRYIVTAYEVAEKNYATGEYEPITEKAVASEFTTELNARVSGLEPGKEYQFTVRAVTDGEKEGEESNKSEPARTFTKPSAPVITSLVSGMGSRENLPLAINWEAPKDDGNSPIIGYDVYVTGPNGAAMKMNLDEGLIDSDTTQYVINNDVRLKSRNRYEVTVVAHNAVTGEEDGVPSESVGITLGTIAPPKGITVVPDMSGTVRISWPDEQYDDVRDYIENYVVYVNDKIETTVTNNEVTLEGYAIGDKLKIEISVLNVFDVEGDKSAPQNVTIGSSSKVSNVRVAPGKESATITWSATDSSIAPSFRPLYYNIYKNGEVYDTVTDTTALKTTVENLEGGREYEFAVSAVNQYGEGIISDSVKVTPWSKPDVVKIDNIQPGVGSFSFTFEDGSGNGSEIKDHQVFVDDRQINDPKISGNTITISGVSNGTVHKFYVTAVNDKGLVSDPPADKYSVKTGVPAAPTYINAIAGDGSIVLVFNKAEDVNVDYPVLGYTIYQNGNPIKRIASEVSATDNTYYITNDKYYVTISGLENGKQYVYSVLPHNANGSGEYSKSITIVPGTPQTPVIKEVKPYSHMLEVTWSEPEYNTAKITKYTVYVDGVPVIDTPNTSATVGGLDNGQTYAVTVSAHNHSGEGGKSSPVTAVPIGVADVVSNVKSENTYFSDKCGITLTWDTPKDNGGLEVTGYKVVGENVNIDVPDISGSGTASISDLELGQNYDYDIIPINEAGEGKAYTITVTTMDVPDAPEIIGATSYNNSIFVSWKAPETNGGMDITDYFIYAEPLNGGDTVRLRCKVKTDASDVPADDTVIVEEDENGEFTARMTDGLRTNRSYTVTVSAMNIVGEGEESRSIRLSVKDVLVAKIPGAPLDLSASARDQQIILNWKAPLDDGNSTITSYQIWAGSDSDSDHMNIIDTVDGYTFSYTDTGLRNGIEKFYRVKAVNSVSIDGGPFSDAVSATPIRIAPPSKPEWPMLINREEDQASAYKVDARETKMTLTWEASTGDPLGGAISYKIYVNGKLVDTVSGTSYVLTPLDENTKYNIQIRAVNEIGGETAGDFIRAYKNLNIVKGKASDGFTYDSYYENGVFANIDSDYDGEEDYQPVYSAPSAPKLSRDAGSSILTWTTPANDGNMDIKGYNLYINDQKINVPVNASGTYQYNLGRIQYGQLYVIYVKAYNNFGEGESSNPIFINPEIEAPSNMEANIVEDDGDTREMDIRLKWEVSNLEATGYVIYVNGSPITLGARDANLIYDNSGVNPIISYYYQGEVGHKYNFAVSSKYDDAESNLTDTVTVNTIELMPVPQNVSISTDTMTLAWNTPTGDEYTEIDHYNVYINGELEGEADKDAQSETLNLEDSALVKLAAVSKRGTVGAFSKPVKYNVEHAKDYDTDTPSAPTSLKYKLNQTDGVLNNDNNVTITWVTGAIIPNMYEEPAEKFNIYFGNELYKTINRNDYAHSDENDIPYNEYSFTATPGTDYDITIEPVAANGKTGPVGNIVVPVPENVYESPAKPTLRAELNDAKTKVKLTWDTDPELTYRLVVNGNEDNKIPVTSGYEYNLTNGITNYYTFTLEAVKTYHDGGQGISEDTITINTNNSEMVDESYNSDKPVITGSLSSGARVKVFWKAPEKLRGEKGEISEYKISVKSDAENSVEEIIGSVSADQDPLVYTVDFDNLTSTKTVKIIAYKEVNGVSFPVSTSDPWIISPKLNKVVNRSDFTNNNQKAEVTNKDANGDGLIDDEREVRIPIDANIDGVSIQLLDAYGNARDAQVITSENGQNILVFILNSTIPDDMKLSIVAKKVAHTSYTVTDIPANRLSETDLSKLILYAGDLDEDGAITASDASTLKQNIGRQFSDTKAGLPYGDLDQNTAVNASDMGVLFANIGKANISVAFDELELGGSHEKDK